LPCGECAREYWHRQFSVAPGDVAPDGAEKSFLAGGYKYFAPTVLPATGSMPLQASKTHSCPVQKIFAPLRLKMTLERALPRAQQHGQSRRQVFIERFGNIHVAAPEDGRAPLFPRISRLKRSENFVQEFLLALNLTFSPKEKEQQSRHSIFRKPSGQFRRGYFQRREERETNCCPVQKTLRLCVFAPLR
jgi:hypothetical protein